MPTDDLADLAKADIDYYALLGSHLTPLSTEKDITSSYRRTALKHHPDKNPDDPTAAARFHELTVAYEILTDPAHRATHDAARAQREAKKAQSEKYDTKRKVLIDQLERGEAKGRVDAQKGREEMSERERLAEDGRRRRRELDERRRKEREEAEGPGDAMEGVVKEDSGLKRAVKVRWDPNVASVDAEGLRGRFKVFGGVDGVTMRGERKVRVEGEKRRKILETAVVVFESVNGALAAVEGVRRQQQSQGLWRDFIVEWAEGKEPEGLQKSERLTTEELKDFKTFEADVLARMRQAQSLKSTAG